MGDQIVLVHVGTDRIFELNPTAARIWDLITEGHNRGRIQELLLQEFLVSEESASEQIDQLLSSLLQENIISVINQQFS